MDLMIEIINSVQMFIIVTHLCIIARGQSSFVSLILSYNSPLISQQDKDDGQTDTSVNFLPLLW